MQSNLHFFLHISVQYPVVAAGTALLAAAALGATSFAGPATVVGGGAALAAGAGGMMVAEEMCLGKYQICLTSRNNVLLFQGLSTADPGVDSAVNLSL